STTAHRRSDSRRIVRTVAEDFERIGTVRRGSLPSRPDAGVAGRSTGRPNGSLSILLVRSDGALHRSNAVVRFAHLDRLTRDDCTDGRRQGGLDRLGVGMLGNVFTAL